MRKMLLFMLLLIFISVLATVQSAHRVAGSSTNSVLHSSNNKQLLPTRLTVQNGEALAKLYCASCHLFPEPDLLDKLTWKDKVLPNMGWRMGIRTNASNPYNDIDSSEVPLIESLNVYPKNPIITKDNWQKIVNYYLSKAPVVPLPSAHPPLIMNRMSQFYATPIFLGEKELPKTSLLKFDTISSTLFVGDATNELYALDKHLDILKKWVTPSAPVDIEFFKNKSPNTLCIGSIAPSEKKEGSLIALETSSYNNVYTNLARPVFVQRADLNGDGREDLVMCQFGNHSGKLAWYEDADLKKEHILLNKPGSRKVEIIDMNQDGKLDIVVMMAQSNEGIYLFENKGNNAFKLKPLVQFPPVYGVSYFELVDFDKDGHLDILMTNGDNWDISRVKKRFHGVRILMNDGRNNFNETFFFPMYGASKAIARDFDGDGDIDIAAISFYDDLEKPEQGFIFLKNTGDAFFEATSIQDAANGKWLTMEAADIDQDGDTDIVLGSFIYSISEMMSLINKGVSHFPQLLVLVNNKK